MARRRLLTSPARLRWILGITFLALAIPSLLLSWQAQREIRWESWHQQRAASEQLAQRIDAGLQELLLREEQRGYADYRFLILARDSSEGLRTERSPLAALPQESDVPGLLGYFQIDAQGQLSTPLLPGDADQGDPQSRLDGEQRQQREALQTELAEVLGRNRLLPRTASPGRSELESDLAEADYDSADVYSSDAPAQVAFDRLNVVGESAQALKPTTQLEPAPLRQQAARGETAPSAAAPSDTRSSRREQAALLESRPSRSEELLASSPPSPVSEIQTTVADAASREMETARPSTDSPAESEAMLDRIQVSGARVRRTDIEAALPATPLPGESEVAAPQAPRISIFESELDPFEFSVLDSGHLVLFRRAWREGQRSIQGLLIEQQPFLDAHIGQLFAASELSRYTSLQLHFRDQLLHSHARQAAGNGPLEGEPLYQHRPTAPFGELELHWILQTLPVSASAQITRWTALVLLSVLLLGFIALYRLGLGQLLLARQQQNFIAAVSHELKTPLTSIRMYGELLRESWVSEDKRREYIAYIHEESERLSRLITNVLQLARMERDALELDCQTIGVAELFDLIRSRVASAAQRSGFEVQMELPAECAELNVEVDRDALLQVMINLVDNALKFSTHAELRRIDLAARCAQDRVIFSVRDYGPGVPGKDTQRVFDLFYRAGNELTRETTGTGIGLALVKQLVEAMQGQVCVVNRQPGAEFQVSLPTQVSPHSSKV